MRLDNRVRALIAVGASVTANCESCLKYHVESTLGNGGEWEEITEAVEIGKMVRQGAASRMDKLAFARTQAARITTARGTEGCGCTS